ncbi:uncharacterized protein [Nicotiana sylvestris]|uniref:uncharacterized protein n=1 Tax=Nicotiana sylvestris TaxID=4096 RepID=UPI00388C90D3
MTVETKAAKYDSFFTLMAKTYDDEEDNDDEVNFLDVQRNLKYYSPKKLMSLENILTDVYHSLINDKDALTVELGELEQSREDLVVVVVDLEETIESLKKEKKVLIEGNTNIKHERDDLLLVVVDLKETIGEFKMESRPENSQKGKEVASQAHIKLESELNSVKSSLCAEFEKNKQLQEELGRVKSDLEKSLKWTWSSDAITAMYTNNGENRFQSQQKNKVFAEKGIVKGRSLQWYMDSGCSKHMTGSTNDFLSLKALQGESICDKGNKVEFLSKICIVTNLMTGEVVLVAKRYKNIYIADYNKEDKDGEFINAPGETIDIANGKTDLMIQVKQSD